jgi:CBS domain-containing protein
MSLARFKTEVAAVSPRDTVEHAARVMRDRGVGCLLIREAGHPTGLVTDRDLVVRVLARGIDPTTAHVGRFATYDPVNVQVTDGIETVAQRMRVHGVRRVPIVDERGDVVGIVTADDLLVLLGSEIAQVCGAIENRTDSTESV